MLGKNWRDYCSKKIFYPVLENSKIFIVSQWQSDKNKPNVVYLVYRVLMALLFFITWSLSVSDFKKNNITTAFRAKWLIYLTNWGYTIDTIQAILAAIMIVGCVLAERLKNTPNLENRVLKLYHVYWALNTIATPAAFGITVVYWSIIYDATKVKQIDEMNFIVHGLNSILMMIDLWIVAHPTVLLHFIYPALLGIVFAVFSLIYYFCGGTSREGTTYIYKILDWDKPGTTILISIGVLIFLILLHVFVWFLHKLRIKLQKNICSNMAKDECVEESKKETQGYVNEALANETV